MKTFDLRVRFDPETGKGRVKISISTYAIIAEIEATSSNHAALVGLNKAIKIMADEGPCVVRVANYYVAAGARHWRHVWRANGWVRSDLGVLAHSADWIQLDDLLAEEDVAIVYKHKQELDTDWFFHEGGPGEDVA